MSLLGDGATKQNIESPSWISEEQKARQIKARPSSAPLRNLVGEKRIFSLLDLQKQLLLNVATHNKDGGSDRIQEILSKKSENAHKAVIYKVASLRKGINPEFSQ